MEGRRKPRIVGSDNARVQPVEGVSDQSGNYLARAGEAIQQGYDQGSQGVKALAQLTQQVTENQIAGRQATTQASMAALQTKGSQPDYTSSALGGLASILQGIQETNQRKKELEYQRQKDAAQTNRYNQEQTAAQAKDVEERQTKLTTQLRDHLKERVAGGLEAARTQNYITADERLDAYLTGKKNEIAEYGPTAFVVGARKLYADLDLKPEDRVKLQAKMQDVVNAVDSQQYGAHQASLEKLQGLNRDTLVAKLRNYSQNKLALLATSPSPEDAKKWFESYQQDFQSFLKEYEGQIDPITAVTLEKQFYEDATKANQQSSEFQVEAARNLESINGFAIDIQEAIQKRQAGGTEAEFRLEFSQLRAKWGLPTAEANYLGDPMAGEEAAARAIELRSSLEDANRKGFLQGMSKIADELDYVTTAQLASPLISGSTPDKDSPNLAVFREAVRNGQFKGNPIQVKVLAVADFYISSKKKIDDLNKALSEDQLKLSAWESSTRAKMDSGAPTSDVTDLASQLAESIAGFGKIKPQDQVEWVQLRRMGSEAIAQQMAQHQQQLNEIRQQLVPYGLQNGGESLKALAAKNAEAVKGLEEQIQAVGAANPQQMPGSAPNFNQATKVQVTRAVLGGKKIILPIKFGTKYTITSGYGVDRGNGKKHGGIDIAVSAGTSVTAIGSGVVLGVHDNTDPNGYGSFVDIKMDNGTVHRYGHLRGFYVREGQKVFPGMPVAKSGGIPGEHGSGHTTGAHLHFEVRKSAAGGRENTLDPVLHMSMASDTYNTVQPRSNTKDWSNDYNPYFGNPGQIKKVIPKGALPIVGGYIQNGKVHIFQDSQGSSPSPSATQKPARDAINKANPLKASGLPGNKHGFNGHNSPTANYNYAPIARDQAFQKKLAKIADNLGIPAVWIADLIQYESIGSFSPSKKNPIGCVGLIQFCPIKITSQTGSGKGSQVHGNPDMTVVGKTTHELAKMSAVQQLDYVEKYLRDIANENGGLSYYSDIGSVAVAIFTGPKSRKLWKSDPSRILDDGDGYHTLRQYLGQLGAGAGRKYHMSLPQKRASAAGLTHEHYTENCPTCNALVASNTDIVPHEATG